MRLNQFLARAGYGSRRKCEEIILSGKVFINNGVVKNLATQVRGKDSVRVGKEVAVENSLITSILHKPKGYLCSTLPEHGARTIFELLPKSWPRVFYVGRLDKDSEGLLVVTNDGALSQRLTHPSFKLPKTYEVTLNRDFNFSHLSEFLKGFSLKTGHARFDSLYKLGGRKVKVVLTQGLKRQIRDMFERKGYTVKRLVRKQIGSLSLEGMFPGDFRPLNKNEVEKYFFKKKPKKNEESKKNRKKISPKKERKKLSQ